jgi:voltage-gated potassium channel
MTTTTTRRQEALSRYERATELPMAFLALAIIPLLIITFTVELSAEAEAAVWTVDWIIWGIFAVDLGIRTYLSERRVSYLIHHWYDVLIVLLPFLRPFRVLRSTRALRLTRLLPFIIKAGANTADLFRNRGMQWVVAAGLAAVFSTAGVTYLLERNAENGTIDDPGTALWWAISTVTTVGYGDTFPVTAEGKGLGVFLMLVGVAFFAFVTASIAAFLVEFSGSVDRKVTMVDLMEKLETVEAEVKALRAERAA